MKGFPTGRVTVLSPHLDDAVLALGAAINRAVREGSHVRIVSVFAGDVDSVLPASKWDSHAGFATEGEGARARRREDEAACALVGAESCSLPFSDFPYAKGGRDLTAILDAVRGAVEGADTILVPGFPLGHPDHRLLTEVVLGSGSPMPRLVLYAEQPYRFRARRHDRPTVAPALAALIPEAITWDGVRVEARDRLAKWRAARAYRTQLPLVGLGGPGHARLLWMLAHEAGQGGEAVAWLPAPRSVSSSAP